MAYEFQDISTVERGQLVLLLCSEGNIRMGEVCAKPSDYRDKYMCRSELDFGDYSSMFYWPDDLQPIGWAPLPSADAMLQARSKSDD